MTSNHQYSRRPLEEWLVQALRLTTFAGSATTTSEVDKWWESVCGDQPESRNEAPKAGTLRLEGPFGDSRLVLSIAPGRVDWNFGAIIDAEGPTWTKLTESLEKFVGPMAEWLQKGRPVNRLAFGVIVLLPVKDLKTGYLQLGPYLPSVKLDPDTSQNFLYQINRRRRSQVIGDLQVNRLIRWSVLNFRRANFSFSSDAATVFPIDQQFACAADMDINSAPDYSKALEPETLTKLWREFVGLACELTEQGDVL